jgi:hypothetical protein
MPLCGFVYLALFVTVDHNVTFFLYTKTRLINFLFSLHIRPFNPPLSLPFPGKLLPFRHHFKAATSLRIYTDCSAVADRPGQKFQVPESEDT